MVKAYIEDLGKWETLYSRWLLFFKKKEIVFTPNNRVYIKTVNNTKVILGNKVSVDNWLKAHGEECEEVNITLGLFYEHVGNATYVIPDLDTLEIISKKGDYGRIEKFESQKESTRDL